jgi:hypothetical protein
VERDFSAPTEADPEQLYRVVADLGTYADWLDLVSRVEPAEADPGDDGQPAWSVTLRARIGPLSRSKRLRMVRTVDDGRSVRFERREVDGRDHSSWVLSANVEALDGNVDGNTDGPGNGDGAWRSRVDLDLQYSGSLWSGLLDGVLQAAADDATERLQAYVEAQV